MTAKKASKARGSRGEAAIFSEIASRCYGRKLGSVRVGSEVAAAENMTILVGKRVTVQGLNSKPELNGKSGTALSFDDGKGRYTVQLDNGSTMALKPANLVAQQQQSSSGGGMPGGMPDFSSMFGGGAGGMPQVRFSPANFLPD